MLVFFTDLSLMEFHFRYLALILHFSVIDGFKWFWVRSLHKNIQLMLEFLEVPFLVIYFLDYMLMTFLMMVSVILLSMQVFIEAILSTAAFHQRFSFFTVCIVQWCDPMVNTEGKMFRIQINKLLENAFFLDFSWNFRPSLVVLKKSWLERYIQLSLISVNYIVSKAKSKKN